jgi:hypothetical protein
MKIASDNLNSMNSESQSFNLSHPCGIRITSTLRETEIPEAISANKRDMGTGYVDYDLPISEINGANVYIRLCFHNRNIDSVTIFLANKKLYGSGWDEWSREKQILCAKHTEEWLNQLGYKTGSFSWGSVWAGFDSKGGFGCGRIRYKA